MLCTIPTEKKTAHHRARTPRIFITRHSKVALHNPIFSVAQVKMSIFVIDRILQNLMSVACNGLPTVPTVLAILQILLI